MKKAKTKRVAPEGDAPAAGAAAEPRVPPLRDPAGRALFLVTIGLIGLRIAAMRSVGFGDSEALYASYALHPAPAYLDHPGLIANLASLLGEGGAPTPARAHAFTAAIASLVPWMVYVVARTAGAAFRPATFAALAIAAAPEIAIGLFAMTPDVLLAPLWLATLGAAITALRSRPGDVRASTAWIVAGLLAGTAGAAKVSGLLLPVAIVATLAAPPGRPHARTPWPWAGLALGAVVLAPIVLFEVRTGAPLLRHRLVDSQAGAGLSLRNLGALVGGQLAYVSPLLLALAFLAARALFRRWFRDPIDTFLFFATAIPVVVLVPLMLWSRVAEPHWLAPAFLALPIAAARPPALTPLRWLYVSGVALGLAATVFVHAWVLVPDAFKFARPADTRLDISNELFGWDEAERTVRELLASQPSASEVVVVGPHWTVCAQIHARLGAGVRVGCMTKIRDDFDDWLPRASWQKADKILYVSDNRFEEDPTKVFPDRAASRRARASVFRGGRLARTFTMTLFEGAAHAAR